MRNRSDYGFPEFGDNFLRDLTIIKGTMVSCFPRVNPLLKIGINVIASRDIKGMPVVLQSLDGLGLQYC